MAADKWNSILAETQFAVSQATLGLRELAHSIHPERLPSSEDGSYVQYKIHNAFLSLTTGIERLGKIAISLYEWREAGSYPSLRSYGHDIEKIAEYLAEMNMTDFPDKGYSREPPILSTHTAHLNLLTDYAKGNRRYEYLDDLSSEDGPVELYDRWCDLISATEVDDELQLLASVPQLIAEALYRSEVDEILFEPYIDNILPVDLDPRSLRVALDFFQLARWFGATLSAISQQIFYADERTRSTLLVPYLSEIVDRRLLHNERDFAVFEILRVGDLEVTLEAVVADLGDEDGNKEEKHAGIANELNSDLRF